MIKKIKIFFMGVIYSVLMLYFYTFIHESGHVIVVLASGGTIERFVLGLNAYVRYSGAELTVFSEMLNHVIGGLFPILMLTGLLTIYDKNRKNIHYHILYGIFSLTVMGTLVAWIILPILSYFTQLPSKEDITKFLSVSQINPLILSILSLIVLGLLVLLNVKCGLLSKLRSMYQEYKAKNDYVSKKVLYVYRVISVLVTVGLVLVGVKLLLPQSVINTSVSIDIDSKTESYKMPFLIEESKLYDLDLELKAKGILTDIQIYDDHGKAVYEGICEYISMKTSLELDEGNYELVMTFLQDPISMKTHCEKMDYDFGADVIAKLQEVYESNAKLEDSEVLFSISIKE